MKRRHQSARVVVSLMAIPELRGIANGDPARDVRLGATTLLADVERSETAGCGMASSFATR